MHRVHSGEPLRAWAGRPTGRLRRRSAGARFESEGVAVWRAAREPGSWSEGGAAFANRRRPSWGSFSASARASLAVAAGRNGSSSRVRVWQAARSVFRARSSCAAASWSPSGSARASSQGRVVATNRLASSTSRHSAPAAALKSKRPSASSIAAGVPAVTFPSAEAASKDGSTAPTPYSSHRADGIRHHANVLAAARPRGSLRPPSRVSPSGSNVLEPREADRPSPLVGPGDRARDNRSRRTARHSRPRPPEAARVRRGGLRQCAGAPARRQDDQHRSGKQRARPRRSSGALRRARRPRLDRPRACSWSRPP